MMNVETESLTTDNNDKFYRRSNIFHQIYVEWIRMFIWIILSNRWNCWSLLKDLFLRRYIATITLLSSFFVLVDSCRVLDGLELAIAVMYCLSFIVSSVLSLFVKKGGLTIVLKNITEQPEQQELLAEFSHQTGQNADLPAGYGVEDKGQSVLESVMEPRPDLNYENSAGSYDDCFSVTHYIGDSSDLDEPPHRPFVARISADAIKAFGIPLQVFGADSLRVVYHSSDDSLNEARNFETVVQVHNSDSYDQLNLCNSSFSSAGPSTVTNDESAMMVASDLYSDFPYMDEDESSLSICNNLQNDKDGNSD